jgi:hypothetical protein
MVSVATSASWVHTEWQLGIKVPPLPMKAPPPPPTRAPLQPRAHISPALEPLRVVNSVSFMEITHPPEDLEIIQVRVRIGEVTPLARGISPSHLRGMPQLPMEATHVEMETVTGGYAYPLDLFCTMLCTIYACMLSVSMLARRIRYLFRRFAQACLCLRSLVHSSSSYDRIETPHSLSPTHIPLTVV